MRLASFAVASLLLLGGSAWAATGDPLIVTGNGVNVRYGPGLNERVRMQVSRDQAVVELERVGDWVRVEITGTGREGWIHKSLLAPAPSARTTTVVPAKPSAAGLPEPKVTRTAPNGAQTMAPGQKAVGAVPRVAAPVPKPRDQQGSADGSLAVEPAAAPIAGDLAGLAQFRESVNYLNSRAVSVGGVELFTGVEPLGGGTVQVATTDAWATVPPAGQESYANTLADRWAAARGDGPARVQIVDPSGQVVMERTRR